MVTAGEWWGRSWEGACLQIDDLAWIGRTRNVILDVGQDNAVLLDLRLDVADLALQLIAATHLGDELALEGVHVHIQLLVKIDILSD